MAVATFSLLVPVMAAVAAPTVASVAAPRTSSGVAPLSAPARTADLVPTAEWRNHPRTSPANTTPAWGPSFNNPARGGSTAARRNIERIYRMIQSTKGYRVARPSRCPGHERNWPNRIRIALYSFSDNRVADALIRAHRRCVSVQVLMNDHLSNRDVPAFGRLQNALGHDRTRRSWARRCQRGCRGSVGPLHTKMYLFSRTGKANKVVVFGSSNMTGKAANVQWNDLFVWKGRVGLYDQFTTIFKESARDRRAPAPIERNYRNGVLKTMFWPQPGHTKATDRVLKALQEVRCGMRPTGGTGYAGHTAVAINIHAMEGDRGLYIAQYIVKMKKAGCRVRVLYGLIAPRIHRTFKNGGVPTRRTIFDRDDNGLTDMYTHMKYVGINGVVGGDRSARVMYTGSENFSQKTIGGDEVWQRIPMTKAWRPYQNLFDMIWNSNFYSNPKYAFYQQSSTPIHARMQQYNPDALLITGEDLEE
ncbi:phospholipase D-like domain-containing protein [Nocardioides guangzhouensis]|uniref:phospholipase D-like domain-containing protein n=1 Tax=Nocardioides guangzhouensis TaxID=2497878 RepID=UPI0014385002|nr:phospholipase D-like domain-containing protein [Nocardioides guangzhouensis]